MLKCDICSTEYVYKVTSVGGGVFACGGCLSRPSSSGYGIIEKEFLPDYGMVEKSRLRELDRRVILGDKDSKNPTDYFVGRRGENGRVQDREPSY